MFNPSQIPCSTIDEKRFLSRLLNYSSQVQQYRSTINIQKALTCLNITKLHIDAEKNFQNDKEKTSFEDELVKVLLQWFKHGFMKWVNKPNCEKCKKVCGKAIGRAAPNRYEQEGLAGIVEVYECNECKGLTRFPRYNSASRLLDTKCGRCGEWAQAFALLASAIGCDVRFCVDWTDHVWVEIYSKYLKKWVHCDCCEKAFDNPLMYSVGWKKKLSFVIAFSSEEVVDVTKRYVTNWDEVLERRKKLVGEDWLKKTLQIFNMQLQIFQTPDRKIILQQRRVEEEKYLEDYRSRGPVKHEETGGRTSGSKEWREQRGEYLAFQPGNFSFASFKTGNMKGISKKIMKFNNKVDDELKIEEDSVNKLMDLFENKKMEYSDDLKKIVDERLLKWPKALLFPVLDLFRLLIVNENVLKYYIQLESFPVNLIQLLNNSHGIYGNEIMSLRLLSNLFVTPASHEFLKKNFNNIFESIKRFEEKFFDKKVYSYAYRLLFSNYSIILSSEVDKIKVLLLLTTNIFKFKNGDDRKTLIDCLGILSFKSEKLKNILRNFNIVSRLERDKISTANLDDLKKHLWKKE